MWNDIIFGNGEHYNSAYFVSSLVNENGSNDHSFSQNSNSYWISDCIFDLSITVYKTSPQGIKIMKMIDEGNTSEIVMKYVNSQILKKINTEKIIHYIEEEKSKSFKEGQEFKLTELRKFLGVNRY